MSISKYIHTYRQHIHIYDQLGSIACIWNQWSMTVVILLHYSSRNQLRSRDDDVSRDAMEPESLRCARGSPRFQSHKREKMEPMIGGGWWREPACQNFFAQLWRIPSFGKSHTIQNTHHIRKTTPAWKLHPHYTKMGTLCHEAQNLPFVPSFSEKFFLRNFLYFDVIEP